jgi:hypothetical protein
MIGIKSLKKRCLEVIDFIQLTCKLETQKKMYRNAAAADDDDEEGLNRSRRSIRTILYCYLGPAILLLVLGMIFYYLFHYSLAF